MGALMQNKGRDRGIHLPDRPPHPRSRFDTVARARCAARSSDLRRRSALSRSGSRRSSAPPAAAAAAAAVDADTAAPRSRGLRRTSSLQRMRRRRTRAAAAAPEPPVTAPETVPTEQPAAFNVDEIPARFRDEPLPQSGVIDSADSLPTQPPTEPPPPESAPAQAEPSQPEFLRSGASASARNGWSGSAASRWRSAASSWCATRSSRACSARACASTQVPCSRSLLVGLGELARRKENASDIDADAARAHPEHPDRRRHHHRLCRRLGRL